MHYNGYKVERRGRGDIMEAQVHNWTAALCTKKKKVQF
jgi:hypothetical protein